MKKTRTVKISKYFLLVVVFLFGLIILKLSYIVLSPKVDGISLSEFASNRNTVKETIVAPRGTIYDSLGNTLAVNVNSYTVIAYLSESREDDRVKDKEGKLFFQIIVATIPAAIAGLLFEDVIEDAIRTNYYLIALALIFMGIIIYVIDKKSKEEKEVKDISYKDDQNSSYLLITIRKKRVV